MLADILLQTSQKFYELVSRAGKDDYQFVKRAGLLGFDEELYTELAQKVTTAFVNRFRKFIAKNVDSIHPVEKARILKICNNFESFNINDRNLFYHVFNKNLDEIKLKINFNPLDHEFIKSNKAPGYWDTEKKLIVVNILDHDFYRIQSVQDFKTELVNILSTLRHEVQHSGQYQSDKITGLPPKNIHDPNYDRRGVLYNYYDFSRDPVIEHELRDVEFYPRLSDEVAEFKLMYQGKYSPKIYSLLIKRWVGLEKNKDMTREFNEAFPKDVFKNRGIDVKVSPWFKFMQEYDEPRWRKAVTEFSKAVLK